MKRRDLIMIAVLSLPLALPCLAQKAAAQKVEKKAADASRASSPASPTGVSVGLTFYAVDDAMRLKIRDLEYKSDQLEIDIQRMKVKIEENKASEIAIWKEIGKAAAEYAKDKNIDPDKFDFDAAEPNYVQKKHHDGKGN